MKVALELQPCCGNRSGIGVYTYELAKRMQNQDDLEFYGNLFNFLGRNDNTASLAELPMPVRQCGLFPYGVYRRIWHTIPIRYESLFRGGADLTMFFDYIVPPRTERKAVTTFHDMTHLRFPEMMKKSNRRRLERDIRYSAERSEKVVTISEFSKREIMELLGVPEDKLEIVPPAPSLGGQTADFEVCPTEFGVKKPYLLYVGTIEPRKNLVRLINAFARLKREQNIPHQLVLAGGKGWANEEIYQAASPVEDVVFTGYLSDGEKYALYQNAAAFVFPSLYEGFGIPPLEAMAFGCPVVCADAASLPEIVGDAAELVSPLDEISIAQGIWNVLSNSARREELVGRGYEQAKKYTWTASAEKLMKICKAVLGGS